MRSLVFDLRCFGLGLLFCCFVGSAVGCFWFDSLIWWFWLLLAILDVMLVLCLVVGLLYGCVGGFAFSVVCGWYSRFPGCDCMLLIALFCGVRWLFVSALLVAGDFGMVSLYGD